METILFLLIGVAAGFAVAWFWMKSRGAKTETDLRSELAQVQQACAVAEARLVSEQQHAHEQMESEQDYHRKYVSQLQEQFAKDLAEVEEHAEELRAEAAKQQETKNKLLQEELRNMTATMLNESKAEMGKENKERLDTLLSPLKERIEEFQKTVITNGKEGAEHKAAITTAFEKAMKQLHDEQERTVRELKEQTERIGQDAASLTQALKGDSKVQGNWGEMILERTLEDCGLTRDEQYFLQRTYRDEEGNVFRPDAVIQFPNSEMAVVDAKVSLTAYLEAVKAEDADARDRFLKQHVASVREHINELSAKNYEKLVPNCIGYVLMFVPYESGYSAALKSDPSLLQYAYAKHIIMLSPSNLLMALQLIHTMWQNYRLNNNVSKILAQSNDLYDKFVTFAETFLRIESDIQKVQKDFDTAKGQLRDGKGNIIRRLDNMKQLGITPKKQLPDGL